MGFDTSLLIALNSLGAEAPAATVFLAVYLPFITVAVFALLVLKSAYAQRMKWELLIVPLVAGIVTRYGAVELIRYFYQRPRPFLALPNQVHALFTSSEWSFPSGHASFFFALSTVVFLYNRRWGMALLLLSALISIARVAAGVHYPTDILAGALVGALIGYLTFKVGRPFAQKILNSTY